MREKEKAMGGPGEAKLPPRVRACAARCAVHGRRGGIAPVAPCARPWPWCS